MVLKKIYSFRKLAEYSRLFRQTYRLYKRKEKTLDSSQKKILQELLLTLRSAILTKNLSLAASTAHRLEMEAARSLPKKILDKTWDFTIALVVALGIAVLIRTMWFELYTIPTGSMRPTLKEGDFLVVSKTTYGLNIPFLPAHFYFNPASVRSGDIFVFTGKNMDISDGDTKYFYLFPGKKQFVKRILGKPGDHLYFYGGQIYGINDRGEAIQELLDSDWASVLEHIPFIRFNGKTEVSSPSYRGNFATTTFYQMNEAVAKLSVNSFGNLQGNMINPSFSDYADLWGFKNFAMARLLTQQEAHQLHPQLMQNMEEGLLYLELTHHPSLKNGKLIQDEYRRIRPDLGYSISLLPLSQTHLDLLSEHMTTCRFVVKNKTAYRYGTVLSDNSIDFFPKLLNVSDGTYEIQNGVVYQIGWGNRAKKLPTDHPLYQKDPSRIHLLYNLGIEFRNAYSPLNGRGTPSRYAYFRDHNLYLLGAPIVHQEDSQMKFFLHTELERQAASSSLKPYLPFIDQGPPVDANGQFDLTFIKKYGLQIPAHFYLALGDNHAMSGDSRQFGFVPEDNIRGSVTFLFWPPGSRWGIPFLPPHLYFTIPNVFVWITFILSLLFSRTYFKRKITEQPDF